MFQDLISRLQTRLTQELDAAIFPGARVALLDYPFHTNVGDSLIWLGELAYLRARGCEVVFSSTLAHHRDESLRGLIRSVDIILLHGGGNFGTIWPSFQNFREKVISGFPDVPIVQLPQSVFFDDDAGLARTASVVGRHKNFTMFVRDRASLDLLSKSFHCNVRLCPDSAFMLGPVNRSQSPATTAGDAQLLVLSRTDKERLSSGVSQSLGASGYPNVMEVDWLEECSRELWVLRAEKAMRLLSRFLPLGHRPVFDVWNILARERMRRGVDILSQGDIIVTDRLHAHILSVLMGKPHVVFDNNNNKLSGFYNEWTLNTPGITLVEGGGGVLDRISSGVRVVDRARRGG
jgi:exopolysaccharide biosynthesis predicted pyruvyltransferase EpsI